MQHGILIVDDERHMCRTLEILLTEELGLPVDTANNYYQALEKIKTNTAIVVADLTMPGKSGLELLREIKKINPDIDVIMMTAHSTVESAVQALKEGAIEYLIKPFTSEKLLEVIERCLKKRRPIRSAIDGDDAAISRYGDLIGASKPMRRVYDLIERAAEIDSTVLITGESGTGKEMVARAIHFNGNRKRHPFVGINCTAIPETLLESEIFGHERGAFSGAIKTKEGKFELANQGTVFLDEIGDMSAALQVKLLRFLQEREFERVGGTATIKLNVRCIAATNRDLQLALRQGSFRDDLFYRLNVFHIPMPPLRERRDDLPLLIDYFLKKKSQQLNLPAKPLTPGAVQRLMDHRFPGNIRELENCLERALIVAPNRTIRPEDLALGAARSVESSETATALIEEGVADLQGGWLKVQEITKSLERRLIERALAAHVGASNSEIAERLGTTRRILELRLKEFGLDKR